MGSVGSAELSPSSPPSSSLENSSTSHPCPQVSHPQSRGNGGDLLGSSSIGSSKSNRSAITDEKIKNDHSLKSVLSQFSTAPPTAAVIGGGMAGVHVAYELARLGFDVSVFEQHPDLAYTGRATTERQGEKNSRDSSTVAYVTGSSSTGGSLPFVGVGMLTASLFDHTAWQHIWKGLFSRSACPNIVMRDAFFPSILSPEFRQWRRGCRRRLFHDREEVLLFGNRLSRVSREVVQHMVEEHPSLAPFIQSSPPVKVWRAIPPCSSPTSSKTCENGLSVEKEGGERRVEEVVYARNDEDHTATQETWHSAHPSPVYLNPVGWTRALAHICTSVYGVKFFTRHRLETLHVRFRQNTEMISSITISSPVDTYCPPHPTGDESVPCDASETERTKLALTNIANAPHAWVSESAEDPSRILSTHAFDVVVLAAGGETGKFCASGTRMPILPLSSVVMSVRSPSPAWQQSLQRFFPSLLSSSSSPRDGSTSSFSLSALRPEANLYGYHLPSGNGCSSGKRASSSLREKEDVKRRIGWAVSTPSATVQEQRQRSPSHRTSLAPPPPPLVQQNEEEICLNGLLSMDVSHKTTQREGQKQKILSRLRAYVSVYTGIVLPEEGKGGGSSAPIAGIHSPSPPPPPPHHDDDTASSSLTEGESKRHTVLPSSPSITLHEYTIGVTPDGLPIVDVYGGFFNAFVCTGFGNRNPDWAPGAAMLLRYLVDHHAQVLRLESPVVSGAADPTDPFTETALSSPLTRTSLSRVEKTEAGLQLLFHGIFPLQIDRYLVSSSLSGMSPSLSSRRWGEFFESVQKKMPSMLRGKKSEKTSAILPSVHGEDEGEKRKASGNVCDTALSAAVSLTPLRVNPYGTNRFRRLLPPRVLPDQEARSLMYLLNNVEEDYVIRYTEPLVRALSNSFLAILEADWTPTWCKDFAFFYLYDRPTPSKEALREGVHLQDRMRRLIDTYETPSFSASSSSSTTETSPSQGQQRSPTTSISTLEKDITDGVLPPFPTPGGTVGKAVSGEEDSAPEGVEQSRSLPSWSAKSRESGEQMERHAREFFSSGSSSSSTFRV